MTQREPKPKIDMISLGNMSSEKNAPTRVLVKKKKRAWLQPRILPVTIVVVALFLTVRANEVLKDFSIGQLYAQQPPVEDPMAQSTPTQLPVADGQANGNAAESPPQPTPAATPAEVTAVPTETATPSAAAVPAQDASAASSQVGVSDNLSPNELDVLQKLAERREELEGRARELDRREANLKAAALKIDEKIGQLKALQGEVDSLLKKYNQQEDEKMRSLVRIYENMKPKEAARIFEQLDMPILLDVIERMKEQKFAPILAEMDVRKASAVSAEMAQRRQLPPPSVSGG